MSRGRPRQFDIDEALQRAMLVFWRRGYRGTSLDDLTEALEINRPSLYAAFGDKEALFLRVVDHYRDRMIVPNVTKLLQCDDLRDGLRTFGRNIASVVTENDTPPGCLIACLLTEECCQSDAIKTKLSQFVEAGDKAMAKVFREHADQLNANLTPESAGKLLIATIHGISVRARAGATRREIAEIFEAFGSSVLKPQAVKRS